MKKAAIAIGIIVLAVIAGYMATSMPQEKAVQEDKPFGFQLSIQDKGLLDNDGKVRGFVTTHLISDSVGNATIETIMLGEPMLSGVYEVTDYQYGQDKVKIIDSMESHLAVYGLKPQESYLYEAMEKRDGIVVIPSDAMPEILSSGDLLKLAKSNVVIYFGKPLDISMDNSGSQENIGDQAYSMLNITYKSGAISAKPNGPEVRKSGNATILEYPEGWIVIYQPESGKESELGREIAALIIHEGWQSRRKDDIHKAPASTGAVSFFTSPAERGEYYMRLLYNASAKNGTGHQTGMLDLGKLGKPDGLLTMEDHRGPDGQIDYSFELHSNETYPVLYDFKLDFIKNGSSVATADAKTVTMKTYSQENGQAAPNLESGEYVVRLVDQEGAVHAAAYAHVPKIRVKLEKITESIHTFLITIDDKPADSLPVILDVNSRENFSLKTEKDGRVNAEFALAPGTHTFTVFINGESGATKYVQEDDGSGLMLYGGLALGVLFLGIAMYFGSRTKRRWAIKTYHRPSTPSKNLDIPYDTFLTLFAMSQEDRAKDLPLSISDLRIGLRKHATYNGSPLFVTDSNLYTLLDSMVKKGRFLSYGGYFLPAQNAGGKPIEYWAVKRRLCDHFIEKGEEPESAEDADFLINGRLVHIWQKPDPKKALGLCSKGDCVIIFSTENEKDRFISLMHGYDPSWMKLLLELQYGRLSCQTIDDFLERGLNAKG